MDVGDQHYSSSNSGSNVHTFLQIVLNFQKYAEHCQIESTFSIVTEKQMTLDSGCSFPSKIPILPDPVGVDPLRMYCIDTRAIAFMFNGGSSCGSTIHPIDTKNCMVYLCY